MRIGNKNFDTENNVYIMGILNVTPDSFSDGGKFNDFDRALFHVEEMIKCGADIIDVGGESTRPGHIQISDEEEIQRVVPILEAIRSRFDTCLSLDTYKSGVVRGASHTIDLVNDVWGFKYDANMARTVKEFDLACCLMHNRKEHDYKDFWRDLLDDLNSSIKLALEAGIEKDRIMIDGGVGFQKSYEENLMVINRTEDLCNMGYPVLLATSKKSVIGTTIDKPVTDRTIATLATTAIGVQKGASFVRIHDVCENADVIKMTKAILSEKKWSK